MSEQIRNKGEKDDADVKAIKKQSQDSQRKEGEQQKDKAEATNR